MTPDLMRMLATFVLTGAGLGFYLAGTLGLLRFPDTFSRLHALTKADNLGLGLLALGLAFQAGGWADVAKLALIWVLALQRWPAEDAEDRAANGTGGPDSARDDGTLWSPESLKNTGAPDDTPPPPTALPPAKS